MLVEFSELLDRTELSPVATNMTVEAMPNDNLVSGNVYTFFCIVSLISPYDLVFSFSAVS